MSDLKAFLPHLFGNKKGKPYLLPEKIEWERLNFEETLMFHALSNSLHTFVCTLAFDTLSTKEVLHLFAFEDYLPGDFHQSLITRFKNDYEIFQKAQTAKALSYQSVQEILDFKNNKLSIFVFLHKDRTKPGKLFIRKADGHFYCYEKEKNKIWSIPILGLSGRGLPFYCSNGSTPCGVMSIDSVMPEANKNYEFGKFRRLVVNFLPASQNESLIKKFLPQEHHRHDWWLEAVIGRDLGRNLLRIHGTGRVNKNFFSPFYPLVPTSGCLATMERKILGFWQRDDQRMLLDALMDAAGLVKNYENESKIQALLYVMDFDDTYQTLEFRG